MINLINLLNTAIISASMGANLVMDRPEPKRANSNTYSYDFQANNSSSQEKASQNTWNYGNNIEYTYNNTAKYYKWNLTSITTPYTGYATRYYQTKYGEYREVGSPAVGYNGTKHQNTTTKVYNDSLTYIQITPNNVNQNNKVKLRIGFNFAGTWQASSFNNLYLKGMIYNTTEDISMYYNKTTFTTTIYEIEQELTSPQNGYAYMSDQISMTLDKTQQQQYVVVEKEIMLNPTKTNYVMAFIHPEVDGYTANLENYAPEVAPGSPDLLWTTKDSPESWFTWAGGAQITIEGQYAVAPSSYEVIDIPGLMFQILTMPFTFVSVAFNLTLFPGTPYQVNLSNLFLSILGILVFVILIKVLLNFKGME